MPAVNSPFFGIQYGWALGESSWGDPMNVNMQVMSFLDKGAVDDFVGVLPGSPSDGDSVVYTVDNQLYFRIGGSWLFVTPQEGMEINKLSDGTKWQWNGSAWVENTPVKKVDLANTADPTKGAGMVGWERSPLAAVITTAHQMLDAQAINLWEFATLVTSKPNPSDPSTWDWSPALLGAATVANGMPIDGMGQTYRIINTDIPETVNLKNITFKPFSSVTGQVLLTISGDDSNIDVRIDADGKGIGGVEAKGDRVKGFVHVSNVVGQEQATGGTQGALKLSGTDADITVFAENLLIGTSSNTSIPRLVTTDNSVATATRNTFRAIGSNVQCGWVTTQDEVHCDFLNIDGVLDNGIYHLQGRATAGTVRVRDCDDEPVVCKGRLHIDNLTLIDCDGFCSMSNGDLSVGHYEIISSDPAKATRALALRADNVASKASIGRLSGNLRLVQDITIGGIFQFTAGTVDLTVGEIDLKVHYVTGSTKILCQGTAIQGINIGRLAIELIDETGTLTSVDKFDFRLPTALAKLSYLGDVFNVSSTGEIRVTNVAQDLLQVAPGSEVSTTFGPYILQETTVNQCPRIFIGPGIPTVGTWLRGDTMIVKLPSIGSVSQYRCTTGGTPGTWRAVQWSVGRGLTRPTLGANDIGVMFMDNNLDANGKPIWWNGTAWVDATGATV